jgi:Fe-S oxidoreductase
MAVQGLMEVGLARYLFAPGCALVLYKRSLVDRLLGYLRGRFGDVELLLTCCRHTPEAARDRCVINVCPGCDRRYRENYENPSTISLWEVLAESGDFDFPDHASQRMTILDACPTRDQRRVHDAVRRLIERMNIAVVEPDRTRERSTCCGDTFYGRLPTEEVLSQMKAKAASMPADDVIVYCVSCSKSMFNGGRRPRYLIDLLFSEETLRRTCDPVAWHAELDEFIEAHSDDAEEAGGHGHWVEYPDV